jgi:hypothetical protein
MTQPHPPAAEHWPFRTRLLAPMLRRLRFPPLPPNPKTSKWYRITPPRAVSASGDVYHGSLRIGTENKLIIMFHGGGVSWNEHMAARPVSLYRKPSEPSFYASEADLIADLATSHGIGSRKKANPFRDWSMISLSYSSGDFHIGTGDFPYTTTDGGPDILHHHGYTNYRAVMQEAMKFVGSPDQLVVTGFSAGGFGTALLTDDIMRLFPDCMDVTSCVDGGFMLYDGWRHAAESVWCAPTTITDRLVSSNITLDALRALHNDHGDRVRIQFVSSTRDVALCEYWSYVDSGVMRADVWAGDAFQADLAVMCRELQTSIPGVGLFIYDTPAAEPRKQQTDARLTRHCIINSAQAEKVRIEGVTPLEWLWNGAQGHSTTVGLRLLDPPKA